VILVLVREDTVTGDLRYETYEMPDVREDMSGD
jgi:hypothetical protein